MNNEDFKPNFYSTGCPICKIAERLMENVNKEINTIQTINIILDIAKKHKMTSLPILEYEDGKFLSGKEVVKYIKEEWLK